jgi:hypothetical protein
MPTRPPIDEQLTMASLPCSRIWAQLVPHAVPHPAKVNRVYASEFFAAGISGFHGRRLHTGVVVCRIQSTEGGDSLLDHCCHFSLVSRQLRYSIA